MQTENIKKRLTHVARDFKYKRDLQVPYFFCKHPVIQFNLHEHFMVNAPGQGPADRTKNYLEVGNRTCGKREDTNRTPADAPVSTFDQINGVPIKTAKIPYDYFSTVQGREGNCAMIAIQDFFGRATYMSEEAYKLYFREVWKKLASMVVKKRRYWKEAKG